ncbi:MULTISPECIES: NAD(P)/FAD-dependent oxidoreductase [Mycobacteriaceae]|uniref:NAD(P)/FAD-dependent oxidoreductase n=1 Tax=Mycobacteriaceae TaxID=1762 RepID=UPI000374DD76|nr:MULTISPECIES: FAD-dependent oxidoreductase [Mycobacteriaceae]AHC23321.2 pyridine nucleotide-disulfide oxidoreductase [Mycolicibacterium neoaurum VKM Ac-1815D]AMO04054.1 pyridine nucleotide-disulfide oxidoreductase [Mycolicibacterium neoaurum]AXK77680.1 FAD-dependent oxidoreductase [Mycolicibacterium neoaurum]KJQ49845.1 pyridine nucleotide-disulfide oxidoreductase [Mycolicibacterium neoaurum]KUM07631.1 pyridine nucleotide-disulfide oxidoreductase [Mycolicibacterium neoaurum]
MPTTQIVVIGGGYAGVLAANRVLQRADVDVALVNPRPEFVERIRLHQLVAGTDDAVADYATVLSPRVRLIVDSADKIDADARKILLASGSSLAYDHLIYAVGSTAAVPASVPGAAEFAYPLGELEAAHALATRMAELAPSAPIVVVGGGLTGIEAAAEFAESGRAVTVVTDTLGPSLAAGGRRSVAARLHKLGVGVLENARVAAVTTDHVTLADGREVPAAVTVWTAGFGVPTLAANSGLATDSLGRLVTDETLTSVGHSSIVAAGDAAAPSALPLRMSCQLAMPLAAQAADTVLAHIEGRQPRVLNPASVGQCISLGRHAGTIQLSRFDDTAIGLHIGGRLAATIKESVCAGTLNFLAKEARKPGGYFWPRGGKRAERLSARPVHP